MENRQLPPIEDTGASNNPEAVNHLSGKDLIAEGDKYWPAQGAKRNSAIAIGLYTLAYEKGEHKEAARRLHDCYAEADNGSEAFIWLQRAADAGVASLQYKLGSIYANGPTWLPESKQVSKDRAKAFEYYEKAAINNDADAQYQVGCLLEYGNGVDKDVNKAFEWFEKCAEQIDHVTELTKVGLITHMFDAANNGSAVALRILDKKNINQLLDSEQVKELKKIKKLAKKPENEIETKIGPDAKYRIAITFEKTSPNHPDARQLLMEAARDGHQASIKLLSMNELLKLSEDCWKGTGGVTHDSAKAIEFASLAFEKGSVAASIGIYNYYKKGASDLKPDGVKAFQWLRRGAEQGVYIAQYMIGEIYEKGDEACHVVKNEAEARKCYLLATLAGGLDAKTKIEEILSSELITDMARHKEKMSFINLVMDITKNKPAYATNVLNFKGIENLLNEDQIKQLKSTRTVEQEKQEKKQKAAKEKKEKAERVAREQLARELKTEEARKKRDDELRIKTQKRLEKQEKEKAEKDKKPDEELLLSNTLEKIKMDLDVPPDFESLARDQAQYQGKYHSKIKPALDIFSKQLDASGTKRRAKEFILFHERIKILNDKCKKIANARYEFSLAKVTLLFVCNGLQGQLTELARIRLEKKLKKENKPVTFEDFEIARNILSGEIAITDANSQALQRVGEGLSKQLVLIKAILPGYTQLLIDEDEYIYIYISKPRIF